MHGGIKVISRSVNKIKYTGIAVRTQFRNRCRSAKKKVLNISKVLKRRTGQAQEEAQKINSQLIECIDIIKKLLELGARVKVYDPIAMENCQKQYPDLDLEYSSSVNDLVKDCDAVLLVTDWREFNYIDWEEAGKLMRQKIVVDGRNMLQKEELAGMGFEYKGVGR